MKHKRAHTSPQVEEIIRAIDKVNWRIDHGRLIADIFECSALALSNKFDFISYDKREKRYLEIIKNYLPQEQKTISEIAGKIFTLLSSQVFEGVYKDYLGELFMNCNLGNKKTGQFFTPYDVSKFCAELSLDTENLGDKIINLNDPTCGSGGMMIAAIDVLNRRGVNYTRNCFVDCGDIDIRCVHMAYLQLSLTGTPAIIKHQDALSRQLWDAWRTPAYLLQYPRFCKFETLT